MLRRLKVNVFKTLIDVDVRFGPFTCIAGGNGVGKSNLFDAIQFLSYLAEKPLDEAASLVRNKSGKGSIRSIFHKYGEEYSDKIEIEAEMIIPKEGVDVLGQNIKADFNYLRYTLELAFDSKNNDLATVKILKEELIALDVNGEVSFENSSNWNKYIQVGNSDNPIIFTDKQEEETYICYRLSNGGTRRSPANRMRGTLLSSTYYNPEISLARQEMQSWRMLQLEPSQLRTPDEFSSANLMKHLGSNGSNLPTTLYKMVRENPNITTQIANRLSELIGDIKELKIDKDDKRQLLSLIAVGKDGTSLPARALSDGTLRFLALAVLEQDYTDTGLICLEEPENGIHPSRIPAIIDLLRNIPVDTEEEIDEDNPLRQVIINTHSPKVVAEVPEGSLLFAELREVVKDGKRFKATSFSALSNTWRTEKGNTRAIAKGDLVSYLNLNKSSEWPSDNTETKVIDRPDLQDIQGKMNKK